MSTVWRCLVAVLLFAILMPASWCLWVMGMIGIGALSQSSPMGICGPYGPLGDFLLGMAFFGLIPAIALSVVMTRKVLRRLWPVHAQPEPIPPPLDAPS